MWHTTPHTRLVQDFLCVCVSKNAQKFLSSLIVVVMYLSVSCPCSVREGDPPTLRERDATRMSH